MNYNPEDEEEIIEEQIPTSIIIEYDTGEEAVIPFIKEELEGDNSDE